MATPTIKLFTWKTWLGGLSAGTIVVSAHLWFDYKDHGYVSGAVMFSSVATFLLIIAIMAILTWWGNRPEPEEVTSPPNSPKAPE
jgi:hypothetical protein